MNKTELVEKVIKETGVEKAEAVINSFMSVISEAVNFGNPVTLNGFGKFECKVRAARTARNPRTGEEVEVPETRVPVFKAGKTFKNYVNGK